MLLTLTVADSKKRLQKLVIDFDSVLDRIVKFSTEDLELFAEDTV